MQSPGALRRVMWAVSLCVSLGVLGAAGRVTALSNF